MKNKLPIFHVKKRITDFSCEKNNDRFVMWKKISREIKMPPPPESNALNCRSLNVILIHGKFNFILKKNQRVELIIFKIPQFGLL